MSLISGLVKDDQTNVAVVTVRVFGIVMDNQTDVTVSERFKYCKGRSDWYR